MAMKPHPITGVLINDIDVRHGPISEQERDTARLLLADGYPRWVVAAMLGRFPLAFDSTGRKPQRPRGVFGRRLSIRDAARDPRQTTMTADFDRSFDDMFGTRP